VTTWADGVNMRSLNRDIKASGFRIIYGTISGYATEKKKRVHGRGKMHRRKAHWS
jgi:hypothetical protein